MDWTTGIAYISPIPKRLLHENSIIAFEIIIGILKVEILLGDTIYKRKIISQYNNLNYH